MIHIEKYNQLQSILSSMIVPFLRRDDLEWLLKNLGIRNQNHPRYTEAIELIKYLIKINGGG